jgi:hypothetical protein
MVTYKTKGERVQEAVRILKKLQEVGIRVSDSGYHETKEYLDEWIKNGESRSYNYEFVRYGRKCELVLPSRVERAATMVLRAPTKPDWAGSDSDSGSEDEGKDKEKEKEKK